jgi:hypothetical protein
MTLASQKCVLCVGVLFSASESSCILLPQKRRLRLSVQNFFLLKTGSMITVTVTESRSRSRPTELFFQQHLLKVTESRPLPPDSRSKFQATHAAPRCVCDPINVELPHSLNEGNKETDDSDVPIPRSSFFSCISRFIASLRIFYLSDRLGVRQQETYLSVLKFVYFFQKQHAESRSANK